MRPILKVQAVKTKVKSENVEILNADDFFKKLKELKVVKSDSVKANLSRILCIDESYLHSLMFKKLVRVIKDFRSSQSLTCIGTSKLKEGTNELEEEYYDEEESKSVQSLMLDSRPQPQQPSSFLQASQ